MSKTITSDAATLEIKFKDIDLKQCTDQGLDFMLDCLITQEWYEAAAEVRDEINQRKQ